MSGKTMVIMFVLVIAAVIASGFIVSRIPQLSS